MRKSGAFGIVAGLTLIGATIRTAIAFNGGLWRDEALFLGVVKLPTWGAMLDFLRFYESHPPLFYAMMRLWLGVFGPSDAAALALPIAFGAALVPATYAAGASMFERRTGLIAAGFIAFAPRATEFASMVRPYSFLALCVLLSMWALVMAVESGGLRRWAVYSATVTVMIFTHNWAWLVVAAQVVAVLYLIARRPRYRQGLARPFALALAVSCLVYLPWLSALLDQVRGAGHSPLPTEGVSGVLVLVLYALFAVLNATLISAVEFPRWVGIGIVAIAIGIMLWGRHARTGEHREAGLARTNPPRPAELLLFATFIADVVIATLISPRTNMLVGACLSSLAPVALLLLAEQASRVIERSASDPTHLRFAIVVAVGFTLASSYALRMHDLLKYPRANTREVVARLRGQQRAGDLLVIVPGWLTSSVNHYEPGVARQIAFPDSGASTRFDFSRLYERMSDTSALVAVQNRISEAALRGGRVWLLTDFASPDSVVAASDRQYAVTHRVAGSMARVRIVDIRAFLRSEFGAAVTTIRTDGSIPSWEEVHAELYAGRAKQESETRAR